MAKHASVDAYVDDLDPSCAELVRRLRAIVRHAVPDAKESIKWAHPTYEKNGPFCYIKAFPRHVNLGFWRGASLDDPDGIVVSGGDKMGHVRVTTVADVRARKFEHLVRQAAALNERLGDPSRTR